MPLPKITNEAGMTSWKHKGCYNIIYEPPQSLPRTKPWLDLGKLKWLVGLKLIQLEQQKTQLPFIILAKNVKPIICRVIKGT